MRDLSRRRMAWNDYIDNLEKTGMISRRSAETWVHPSWLETYGPSWLETYGETGRQRGRRKGRKYDYLYIVQGTYNTYRWEDLTASDSRKEAHRDLRMFNWKGPHVRNRIVQRRFLRKDYED
jgi:hypothetical protein